MSNTIATTLFNSVVQSRFAHAAALTANLALSASLLSLPAFAAQATTGQFEHAPRLVSATTTQRASFVSQGTYDFTLTVPENAGAPLQAVTISQAANPHTIEFAVNHSRAIASGTTVPLSSIGGGNSNDVTIVFEHPVQPGSTVTISLPANRAPGIEGIYRFGVTAYPVGDETNGLFLGYGRVDLFNNSH